MSASLVVVRPGALTTVQDRGRPGLAHLGVPRSGALDPLAMALANRVVGNDEGAAILETTLDGVAFVLDEERAVAVTGAVAPLDAGGRPAPLGLAVTLRRGELLEVGRALAGVRNYVAIAGGIAVPPVMGSRSTDTLSGTGPAPLVAGASLALGGAGVAPLLDFVPTGAPPRELELRCVLGPRDDELTAAALDLLASVRWVVSPLSNRVALRLGGPPLERMRRAELASEGIVNGSVQVPPGGEPLVFLADHPTTGGYPVVAVVPEPDVWRLAQVAPGSSLRFFPERPTALAS